MADTYNMPTHRDLMNPLLQALHDLGGSGSIDEINQNVTASLDLPEEMLDQPHDPEKTSRTEIEYRLAWARNYLKNYGILENSSRGVWAILPDKQHITAVDPNEVGKHVRDLFRARRAAKAVTQPEEHADEESPEEGEAWRTQLHRVLTEDITPDAFERLARRLLRESGFVQVEVTGRGGGWWH